MFLTKPKPSPETPAVPTPFAEVFWRLVRRTTVPGGRLDPGTALDYWTALQDLPLDALTAAADDLGKHRIFFPAVAEWRQAARAHAPQPAAVGDCTACGGYGLIRICYQSGDLFDVALCSCRTGQWYRHAGAWFVRHRFALQPDQQVANLEDVLALQDTEG